MSYNGSGTFNLYTPGNPVVTGTTISSTWANNTLSDIVTGLSTAICKDGQTTTTQRVPFAQGISNGSQTLTAVADGTATTHAATVGQLQSSASKLVGSVAGTNTITGAVTPTLTAYASGQQFTFVPANTNTGATTINLDSVGAKNIFWNGAACVGGELRQNIPATVEYDGTQFNIIANGFNAPFLDTHPVVEGSADSTKKARFEVDGLTTATTRVYTLQDSDDTLVGRATTDTLTNKTITGTTNTVGAGVLGTEQATTSGTAIDFTGIPSWAKEVVLLFRGVSTSGGDDILIQLGDVDGFENTGYVGTGGSYTTGGQTVTSFTTGFGVNVNDASDVISGRVVISLEDAANFAWAAGGTLSDTATASSKTTAGYKELSAALTQIRVTTTGGTQTFDAGAINLQWR